MDEGSYSPGPAARSAGQQKPRPLSPHLQIYSWPLTMAASITHRLTGVALAGGMLFLTWWLIAAAASPEDYAVFVGAAEHPLGEVVLFGFVWSLSFHILNGIRHLAWDLGYGFKVPTARFTAAFVYIFSILLAGSVFAVALMVKKGLGT